MERPSSDLEQFFALIPVFIGFSGVIVFIYQSYIFLRHGELFLFSMIDAMKMINEYTYFFGDWIGNPEDWIGLHLIMSWTPLALVLLFFGFYLFVAFVHLGIVWKT
jgi:hypothetical protein